MQKTIDETDYRRGKQTAYNERHQITPQALNKSLDNALAKNSVATQAQERAKRQAQVAENRDLSPREIEQKIRSTRKAMEEAAKALDFMEAARLRDTIKELQEQL